MREVLTDAVQPQLPGPGRAPDRSRRAGAAGPARRLPPRQRGELGRPRRRRADGAGGRQPPLVRAPRSPGRWPCVPDLHDRLSAPAPGSSTSASAAAGRRSRSPGPTRRRTFDRGRHRRAVRRDGAGQRGRRRARRPDLVHARRRGAPWRVRGTTRRSPSSASTTCRDPVEVLAAVHRALAPGAPLVVMDEAVADAFAPDGDELERLMYGFSLFVCLPDGLSSPPSVGTGTVMRPSTLAAYGRDAGFSDVRDAADRGLRVLAVLPPAVRRRRWSRAPPLSARGEWGHVRIRQALHPPLPRRGPPGARLLPVDARRARRPQDPGRHRRRARTATRSRSSVSAASGAPRRSTGRSPASGRRRSVTRAATPRTRRTTRSARAAPATPRPCGSSSTRRWCPTPTWSRGSSRSTTRRRACARATTWARSTARRSTSPPPEQEETARELTKVYGDELARRRLGVDHHRDPAGVRGGLLLRRGPAPAVPREEPVRLPLPRQHRGQVPGLT